MKHFLYILAGFLVGSLISGLLYYFGVVSLGSRGPEQQVIVPTGIVSTGTTLTGVVRKNSTEAFNDLKKSNADFSQGLILSQSGSYTGAIDLFQKARSTMTTHIDKEVTDFQIAKNQFSINRTIGASSFMKLATDVNYTPKNRAFAIQYNYMMYRSYNDISIVRAMADGMGIPFTTSKQVILACMQYSYMLYPLPSTTLVLLQDSLENVKTKEDAMALYEKYYTEITTAINQSKKTPNGEVVSNMLGMANIQAQLHIKYKFPARADIETAYKDLIQYDRENIKPINQQYTHLYYADFLAAVADTKGAQKILEALLAQGLHSTLGESLPRSSEFTYIKKMKFKKGSDLAKLQQLIGSQIQKK